MIETVIKIVGFVFNRPIAVLSLLIVYAFLFDLIVGMKKWEEK
ncbi:MAG: hypothetical protein ACE5JO_14015 [Candidatus Binatia bacterium]